MPINQAELGRRLKVAREARRLSQEDVAHELGLSRPTVAQIELGNRPISAIELDKLAYLYGRDMREFLAEGFQEEDALVALFRADPELSDEKETQKALRDCIAIGREMTNLEGMLGMNRDSDALASYALPFPASKGEAVEQAARVAEDERRRLGLGTAPLARMTEILEAQGVRSGPVVLPDDVSGLTLIEPGVGAFVVANESHNILRRRFSYAHEYGHLLFDRNRKGVVSRASDRENLLEVRANAFAAAFLMPPEGVSQFIQGRGKGRPSRSSATVFDGQGTVDAQLRIGPGTQDIQIYNVVHLAHHFGVSHLAAMYRLRNLRFITREELDALKTYDESGAAAKIALTLGLQEPNNDVERHELRHRFLELGLEALRRGEITKAKFVNIASLVQVDRKDAQRLLDDTKLSSSAAVDVSLPGA